MFRYPDETVPPVFVILLGACLLGARITLSIGLTHAGEQKIARVYKQNFTGKVTLQPGTTLCAGRRVNPTWSVYKGKTQSARQGNPSTQIG